MLAVPVASTVRTKGTRLAFPELFPGTTPNCITPKQ